MLGLVLPSNSPGVHALWMPIIPMQIGLVLKPGPQEPWTPYRMAYIRGENKPATPNSAECPFCTAPEQEDRERQHHVHRAGEERVGDPAVIARDEVRLFRTNLRLVACDRDVYLRRLRPEIEVHQQREVRFGDSTTAEHLNIAEVTQAL